MSVIRRQRSVIRIPPERPTKNRVAPSGGGKIVGEPQPNRSFTCHPKCLEWSYLRRMILGLLEDISGLHPGRVVELILTVDEAESESWWADRPVSRIGQKTTVELHLRGWSDEEIERAFGFPHGAVARVISESKIHSKAREVVNAQLEGHPPSRISRDLKIGIPTIYNILESIGEEPNRIRNLAKSEDINRTIVRMYEELRARNAKNIQRRIADQVGLPESTVKTRIQYLRKKGRISTPPMSTVRARKPRAAE